MANRRRLILPNFIDALHAMFKFYKIKKYPISKAEEKHLIRTCIALYDADKNYQKIFDTCRTEITNILSKYNYQPKTPGNTSASNAMHNLPYLVKVLIYMMAYKAFELYDNAPAATKKSLTKPSQQEVLDYIAASRYKLSHNTFTKLGMSPRKFYNILNYHQIELPVSYSGSKKGALGYAINYLTAYAGTLDNFVDLFGGAAYATMAILQDNNPKYYINDNDFLLVNYYYVLSDRNLYKMFRDDIQQLTIKLKDDIPSAKQTFIYCESKINYWVKKYPSSNVDTISTDSANRLKYQSETDSNKSDAAVAFVYTNCFTVTGGKTASGAVNRNNLNQFTSLNIGEFDRLHEKMARLNGIFNSNMLDNSEYLIECFSDKSFALQLAQKNNSGDTSMTLPQINGNPRTLFYSDSPYLHTSGYRSGGIEPDEMNRLIEKLVTAAEERSHFIFSCRACKHLEPSAQSSLLSIITGIFELKRENGNIQLDTSKEYEDMPLLSTQSGKLVVVSAKKQLKIANELLKANQSIYMNIFKEFERYSTLYKKKYQVLTCLPYEKNEKFPLTNHLKVMRPVEVFITDFDYVCPLDYTTYYFEKYSISDFCKELEKGMFKSDKTYKIIPSGQGSYRIQ